VAVVETTTRAFPGPFFVLVALFYTVRILWLRRRIGCSPVIWGEPGTPARRVADAFRLFRALILVAMVGRWLWPPLDGLAAVDRATGPAGRDARGRFPARSVDPRLSRLDGGRVALGIDPAGPARLWTQGPFRLVRHPMFSFLLMGQLGLFLAAPSAFTFLCLMVGTVSLMREAGLEAEVLVASRGEAWRRWAAGTPKWPWFLGRRSGGGFRPGARPLPRCGRGW
jgi:Phospholipid methyltransferase